MRIAVLGLGFMGSTHVKAWNGIHDAELAAVYSKDEQKLTGDLSAIEGNLGTKGQAFDFIAASRKADMRIILAGPCARNDTSCIVRRCQRQ